MNRSAGFSEDRRYRYSLTRIWDETSTVPLLGMIGKNPSKADELQDDPTIGKEIALAKRLGCRGLFKVNMYDYIATDSNELLRISDFLRVSPQGLVSNIVSMILEQKCHPVICCWGTHTNRSLREAIQVRGDLIRRKLIESGITPMCLKKNSDGTPAHPLYLPANLELQPY